MILPVYLIKLQLKLTVVLERLLIVRYMIYVFALVLRLLMFKLVQGALNIWSEQIRSEENVIGY